ncbi:hypothetical protein EU546_04575 [Candidatus Thorarchaeota archaeon]|nr:MAG: hypothetical protein EU546_04575 [Candidatus Thorarchaeota archaeon]
MQVASRDYTSQDTTSGMTDTFTIEAEEGDVLRATAICNIAGQLSAQITVTATTTTSTTSESTTEESTTSPTGDGQPLDPTLLILGAVGAVAILAVILTIFRRR